jgi:Protein of unknown function DUF86
VKRGACSRLLPRPLGEGWGEGLKAAHPETPWCRVAGFRDILIHDYVRVGPDEVWNIIEHDLLDLKRKIEAILQELKDECTNTAEGEDTSNLKQ